MSRFGFYEVEVDGVKYKVQALNSDDAREQTLDIDIGGRSERKRLGDTVQDEDSIRVSREDQAGGRVMRLREWIVVLSPFTLLLLHISIYYKVI